MIIQGDFEFESYQKKKKRKEHWGIKRAREGGEISQIYFPIRIKHSNSRYRIIFIITRLMDDENKFNEKYRGLIVHAIVRINRNNIFELNFFF